MKTFKGIPESSSSSWQGCTMNMSYSSACEVHGCCQTFDVSCASISWCVKLQHSSANEVHGGCQIFDRSFLCLNLMV